MSYLETINILRAKTKMLNKSILILIVLLTIQLIYASEQYKALDSNYEIMEDTADSKMVSLIFFIIRFNFFVKILNF